MGRITVKEQDTQATPTSGYSKIYPKTDGKWYYKDDAGDEHEFAESGAPDAHAATHKGGGADVIDSATGSVAGLMSSADKTKIDTVDSNADVTGSNAPQAHASSHQNGGGDEISIAGLSGVLADEQDAGFIKGDAIEWASLAHGNKLYYDGENEKWTNEPLPWMKYTKVKNSDWSPTWAQLRENGPAIFFNTEPAVTSHVGNGTVAYLNGISATTGDTYVVTDTGTLTAGSLGVGPGTIVMWYISAWIGVLAPNAEGYVTSGFVVQLSSTTALISPYTDGTDDGKYIGFDGSDNTGVEVSLDVTFTLPDSADLADNLLFQGPLYVGKMGDLGTVSIRPDTGDKFQDNLECLLLTRNQEICQIGAVNGGLTNIWGRVSTAGNYLQVRRAATWASTNFSTATAIPFDTLDKSGSAAISEWDNPTNPERLYARFKAVYTFAGFMNIDMTSPSAWLIECWLRINGTTEVPGSRLRTGNKGEDMGAAMPAIQVSLDVDDYVEWMCVHTNLTGTLHSGMLNMSTVY